MPTSYFDQFFIIDPANPPAVGTNLTVNFLEAIDNNDNNLLNRFSNDSVDGSDITASWPGDTITVTMGGSTVTITGTTFYLADGRSVFTPTDGTVLSDAVFQSSTFVTSQGSLPTGNLGPPCFVGGTLIDTEMGRRPVEEIRPGDRIATLDRGYQRVRWAGGTIADGNGDFAPICFKAGAIENERDMWLSPQHRVLISGWKAELHYGASEVLVAAKHLTDGTKIFPDPRDEVAYYHLMFARHEVIFSEGVPTESFYPGDEILLKDRETRAELLALLPQLAGPHATRPYTARPTITRREAGVLH